MAICFFIVVAIIHGPQPVSFGESRSGDLAGGQSDAFSISVEQGKMLRFSIDKGDLALLTILYDPAGNKLLEHVSQDFEVVEISFPIDVAGTYRVELQSREQTAVPRRYEIRMSDLKNVTALDRKDSEARQAVARAEVLRANWTEASFRQAIAEYDKAVSIWTSISDLASASQATLKAAEVYSLLSEYTEALKRYQNVEKLAAGDWLLRARALSQMARLQSALGNNYLAQQQLTKALDLFEQHGANQNAIAANIYGEVLSNLAEVSYAKGNLLKSSQQYESALKAFQNDRKGEAKARLSLGYIAGSLGDPEKALADISRSLELYRAINNKSGEGFALVALGLSRSSKRDENGAIKLHGEAIKIFRAIGDKYAEGIALNALGQAHFNLREDSIALSNFQDALQNFEDIGALDAVTMSAFKIAEVHQWSGQLDQALRYLERCLTVSRAAGKMRTEALALTRIANAYAAQGRNDLALRQHLKVLKFYEAKGDRRGQVIALNAYGDFLLLKLEQKQRALDVYSQALPFSEKVGDKGLLLTTLFNLSRANFELGSLDVALSWIQESLKMIEDVRTNVASPEFRASYFSGHKKHYELCIAILMQLDRARPQKGFAADAFLVSEKIRARLLLDLRSESQAGLRRGASAELLKRERELRGSVRSLAQYELDLSFKKRNSSELKEVGKELAELRAEYQAVQAQLRERRSNEAPLDRFGPVDLQRIQNELRDKEALLLQYSLGEKQSYLWAVTAESFTAFELPPRKVIEDAAIEVYKLLTARQDAEKQSNKDFQANVEASDRLFYEKAPHLSQMLLGPVAQQLGNRKVLVVAEGALHYIPFGALPVPGAHARGPEDRPLLIETNEINRSPSISALIAIRAEKKQLPSSDKVVAVVADPVFNRNDERVHSEGSSSTITTAASSQPENASVAQVLRDLGGADGPPRLLHSSEEADAISAAAPRGTTMVAKGFEATRETAMSQRIGEYQIVHFATHGFFYNKHPELSGIVMTMVDQAGTEKNGVMPLQDIYSLDLSAELTVLSACQTGLGKDVSGEGLVGLTHSFMSAGSNTVVASLWKVDDRATANLMADFYRAMLQEGMPTGAALRAAKLKMMQDKRWRAPYFWAGFVLQGEYTNQIVVDRSSRFSIRTVLLLLVPIFAGSLIFYWLTRRLVRARRM